MYALICPKLLLADTLVSSLKRSILPPASLYTCKCESLSPWWVACPLLNNLPTESIVHLKTVFVVIPKVLVAGLYKPVAVKSLPVAFILPPEIKPVTFIEAPLIAPPTVSEPDPSIVIAGKWWFVVKSSKALLAELRLWNLLELGMFSVLLQIIYCR